MLAELLAAGLVSTIAGGIQEKAEMNRKMKNADVKAKQWISEREARKQQAGEQEPKQEQRTESDTIHIDNISFTTSSNTADSALFDEIFKDFEKNFE